MSSDDPTSPTRRAGCRTPPTLCAQAAANGTQDSGAAANAALDKLRDAQQQLAREMSGRSERDIQNALRRVQALAEEQKDVARGVKSLEQKSDSDQHAKAQQLALRKLTMDGQVGQLQSDLERLANEARRNEKAAARKLDDAAGGIRDKLVREKILYSRSLLQRDVPQSARGMGRRHLSKPRRARTEGLGGRTDAGPEIEAGLAVKGR